MTTTIDQLMYNKWVEFKLLSGKDVRCTNCGELISPDPGPNHINDKPYCDYCNSVELNIPHQN